MYKVIIVDDEDLIRQGLRTFVKWNEMGFDVVGEAVDGNQAFELIQSLKPHVVLTDIKMPRCTGIDLMKKIRESGINIKIVVLSGYDEFEYAKAAIEVGAVDYLIKPIKFEKLKEVFLKIKKEYDDKIDENIKMNKAVELLRSQFLSKMVKGGIKNKNEILRQAESINIKMEFNYYLINIIEIDDYDNLVEHYSYQDMDLYKFAVTNISEEISSKYGDGYTFIGNSGEIVLIFCSDTDETSNINSMVYELKSSIESVLDFTVTISVGDSFADISLMYLSYSECRRRADCKFKLGKNRIIFSHDLVRIDKGIDENEDLIESRLLVLLQNFDTDGIDQIIDRRFSSLCSRGAVYDQFYSIIKLLIKFLEKNGLTLNNFIDESITEYNRITKMETVVDITSVLKSVLHLVTDGLKHNDFKGNNGVISEVKEYVNRHLGENITLETAAQRVYMHPMYLSKMFKKEAGINFIDYLTNARIQKAKNLMCDLNLKTYEISEMVGYKSSKHFSKVFKTITGVTPKDYRKNLIGYDE